MQKQTLSFLLLLALAVPQLGATDCGQVLRDPGFDLWCGDELCAWKLERGELRRAPTWHTADAGVELVGTDVAITQLAPVTSGDGSCIHFELVADVADDAEAYLEVDVYGDGQVDRRERLPASHWQPLSYNLHMKAPYDGIRFTLSKKGAGRAVLGRIHAETATDGCIGLPEIDAGPAPLGGSCLEDAGCKSGLCRVVIDHSAGFGVARRCVGCDPMAGAAACGAGMVCGYDEPTAPMRGVPIVCLPAGEDLLGEQCLTGAECATGLCNAELICSTCTSDLACAGGERCGPAWVGGPSVCSPGARIRHTGEPCATDGDCASGACNGGARSTCTDGRPCGGPGMLCPFDDLTPGACTRVGVTGGTCQ